MRGSDARDRESPKERSICHPVGFRKAPRVATLRPGHAGRNAMNVLREGLTDYLELRRGLGFKLVIDERHLRAFIAFLVCRKTSHITTRLALAFATFRKNLDPRSWVQ